MTLLGAGILVLYAGFTATGIHLAERRRERKRTEKAKVDDLQHELFCAELQIRTLIDGIESGGGSYTRPRHQVEHREMMLTPSQVEALRRRIEPDPFAVRAVPVVGLNGISVRICGPGFNHNWGTALPPHQAPIVQVTLEEWSRIQFAIPAGMGCMTDLIVRTADPEHSVCNMWDPHARRWVILSDEDARRPTA